MLLGNLAADRADPVEIGHHNRGVWALTALPDGRVVSGGQDGRILAAVRYIGTAEYLPVGFLYGEVADLRVFGCHT